MIRYLSEEIQDALDDATEQAMVKWDFKANCIAAVEELTELSSKVCQYVNGKYRPDLTAGIQEEIADCYIVLDKLAAGFFDGRHQFEGVFQRKLAKLQGKLRGEPL